MGKKPDQIEREISDQRSRIGEHLGTLQTRVQDDVGVVRDEARTRMSGAFDDAKGAFGSDGIMQQHPLTTMAGALGVGVVLGVASEGFGSGARRNDGSSGGSSGRSEAAPGNSASGIGGLLASIVGPAAGTAQEELQQLVREGFDAVRGQASETMRGNQRVENRDVGVE